VPIASPDEPRRTRPPERSRNQILPGGQRIWRQAVTLRPVPGSLEHFERCWR